MTASGNLPVDFCRQFLPLFTCLSEIVKVRDAKANLEKGVFIARENIAPLQVHFYISATPT